MEKSLNSLSSSFVSSHSDVKLRLGCEIFLCDRKFATRTESFFRTLKCRDLYLTKRTA